MDFTLSDEQEAFRKAVARFVETEVVPVADRLDQAGAFPWPLFRRLGELGYLALRYPEAYGGSEANMVTYSHWGAFVDGGHPDYGGRAVVNPRSGLIGCGHPLGVTGIARAAEVFWQLRGEAGARQVPEAAVGLTHNNSGMGEHVVA